MNRFGVKIGDMYMNQDKTIFIIIAFDQHSNGRIDREGRLARTYNLNRQIFLHVDYSRLNHSSGIFKKLEP